MPEKYRREIEDLLSQIEGQNERVEPKRPRSSRAPFKAMFRFFAGKGWSITPGRIIFASVVLLLIALLFHSSMPGLLAPLIGWGAVVIFILGYALFFINSSGSYEKMWRGQPIEQPQPPTNLWEKLRRKLQRR